MEGRLWSKPSFVLSSHTGRPTQKDATSRFHSSLACRREILDRIGGWLLTKRGDFDQQLIARLNAIEDPDDPPMALAYDKMQCREGEAPAEPHPCRERFFDPRCAAQTLANAHSADQRSAARQQPRPPRSSPVFSQNFRESQCHWAPPASLRSIVQLPLEPDERVPRAGVHAGTRRRRVVDRVQA